MPGLTTGVLMEQGHPIGIIAASTRVLPHLHLALALVPEAMDIDMLCMRGWEGFEGLDVFIDPMGYL